MVQVDRSRCKFRYGALRQDEKKDANDLISMHKGTGAVALAGSWIAATEVELLALPNIAIRATLAGAIRHALLLGSAPRLACLPMPSAPVLGHIEEATAATGGKERKEQQNA